MLYNLMELWNIDKSDLDSIVVLLTPDMQIGQSQERATVHDVEMDIGGDVIRFPIHLNIGIGVDEDCGMDEMPGKKTEQTWEYGLKFSGPIGYRAAVFMKAVGRP